ncbi:glycosyltransferase [Ferrimonas sediminicola]|uniref:glycosyltransferase n=1 Tax=Ferrimonas sediminicola TaxID=2569538 RepID=UPI00145D50E2|nr:glycosyltransferase [Ferrimonas sediminicola]
MTGTPDSSQTRTRKRVLHLAVEYPSLNRDSNTPAVRHFIRANPDVDYRVFALRRTSNPFAVNALEGDDEGDPKVTSMQYWGLPWGMLLFLSMTLLAWRIRRQIRRERLHVDLVHAHKFAFEGIAGWWLSRWLGVPLVLSVRGEAEAKILRFKPHYDLFFRRQLRDAARIYYVSAWFKPLLNARFTIDPNKQKLLPNFVAERHWVITPDFREDHLVSIMDLNVLKKKGLAKLLTAVARLAPRHPKLKLDIIGGGSGAAMRQARQMIAAQGVEDRVTLVGEMDNTQLLAQLPRYGGMVLPSVDETFGMVYVEALMSGVPILHSKETGIDGFLEEIPARVMADPYCDDSVAEAMERLLSSQRDYREWLLAHQDVVAEKFSRRSHIEEYNRDLSLSTLLGTVGDAVS